MTQVAEWNRKVSLGYDESRRNARGLGENEMTMTCNRCENNELPEREVYDDLDNTWLWCGPCEDYALNSENLDRAEHVMALEADEVDPSYRMCPDGLVTRI